jgi:hypothetical protein
MKYVILEAKAPNKGMTEIIPVIFPKSLTHKLISEAIKQVIRHEDVLMERKEFRKAEPVSAGFIDLPACVPYGKSETLELESRVEDLQIIKSIDYFPFK